VTSNLKALGSCSSHHLQGRGRIVAAPLQAFIIDLSNNTVSICSTAAAAVAAAAAADAVDDGSRSDAATDE